ncbi:MAG: hypothetical protein GY716_16045 [bacterium]|nr:hypothetical protein [bacterium]
MGEFLSALLGPLIQLVELIVSCIPHFEIVRCNEAGVRYTRGEDAKRVGPGVRWYLPVIQDIETHHTCDQVLTVTEQTFETKDEKQVTVALVVVYAIVDVLRYEVDNLDADEGIGEAAAGGLRQLVAENTLEDLRRTTRHRALVVEKLQSELDRFGVEVRVARLTDCAVMGLAHGAVRIFGAETNVRFYQRD